jgi:uncharacterized protein with HEPN domain
MNRDYGLFVKDIIAAMDSIEDFVKGMDAKALEKDNKTSSAVIRN